MYRNCNGVTNSSKVSKIPKKRRYFEISEVSNTQITIFLNRVIGIFEIVMTKLKLAATLPIILSNPTVLEILDKQDLKHIVSAFVPYDLIEPCKKSNLEKSIDSIEIRTNYEKCDCSRESSDLITTERYANIYNALNILSSYDYIRKLSKENESNITKNALNFIRQIKFFMEFMIGKISKTSTEERKKQLHSRHTFKEVERVKRGIDDFTNTADEQKSQQQWELDQLKAVIVAYLDTQRKIEDEFNNQRIHILKNAEENWSKSHTDFNERMNNHQQLLETLKIQVEKEKSNNVKIEESIQQKKFKVESQLLSLITKYDTEVSERQEEYDVLMKEFEAVDKEKTQLMEEMDEQLNFYNAILKEKEDKEFEACREKYTNFLRKRCAKIIQRWWRQILEARRKQRTKGKKKKGKKIIKI